MAVKHRYNNLYAYGEVTNDAANLQLVADATVDGDHYLYIEKLVCSVFKAGIGSGGILRIQDSDGTVVHTFNVDGVKDLPALDFGEHGWRLPTINKGLQAIVMGAGQEQASVSIMLKAHLDNR